MRLSQIVFMYFTELYYTKILLFVDTKREVRSHESTQKLYARFAMLCIVAMHRGRGIMTVTLVYKVKVAIGHKHS